MDTYLRCQCVSVVDFFNYIVRAQLRPQLNVSLCCVIILFYYFIFLFPREFVGKIVMSGFQVRSTTMFISTGRLVQVPLSVPFSNLIYNAGLKTWRYIGKSFPSAWVGKLRPPGVKAVDATIES